MVLGNSYEVAWPDLVGGWVPGLKERGLDKLDPHPTPISTPLDLLPGRHSH